MAVFDEPATLEWHEEYLIIAELNRTSLLSVTRLWEQVHSKQESRVAMLVGDPRLAHSRSNFGYWLRSMEKEWFIERRVDTLSLLARGRWLAVGNGRQYLARANFLRSWVHSPCSSKNSVTLLVPGMESYGVSNKTAWMDGECPACGQAFQFHSLPAKWTKAEFTSFYNDAVSSLGLLLEVHGKHLAA
ncbi:MAG: hypothetical protein HY681_05145 [Chloroflexi bacterium]|nr:hypothetical protein [Chloroflexota bacterium]